MTTPLTYNIIGTNTQNFSITTGGDCYTVNAIADYYRYPALNNSIAANPGIKNCCGTSVTLTSNASGGGCGYNYVWAPGGATTTSISVVPACTGGYSTYSVTIKDQFGCSPTTASIRLETDRAISCNAKALNNKLCWGKTTTVYANPSGGTGPYTYLWSNGATSENPIVSPSPPNTTYRVLVTDAFGCIASSSVTITVDSHLTVSASASPSSPVCSLTPVMLTATPSGGTPVYAYSWYSPVGLANPTTATPTYTVTGNRSFTITLTDAEGCTATASITENMDPKMGLSISTTGILCPGGSNGTATAHPVSGTSPYTYLWSPGSQTSSTATALSAGTYTVTVTDHDGCTNTGSVTLTNPIFTVSVCNHSNITCNGYNNAYAQACPIGGTSPLTYSWSNGKTTSTITGLSAGSYIVTVTDHNGCTTNASITITQPAGALTTAVNSSPTCSGERNGSVTATPSGGTAPYRYFWSNGGTNATQTGLSGGTYTITVFDSHGCSTSASVTVATHPLPVVTISASPSTTVCTGDATTGTGTATLTASATGGASPYTYSWAPASTNLSCTNCANPTATISSTTTYTVTVTDNNGCVGTKTVTLTVDPNCCAGTTGSTYVGTTKIFGILPSNITTWSNPNGYVITGVITIPFGQTLNITNVTSMAMASNAEIIVAPGAFLNITNSRLWGCPEMWPGIVAQQNSTVTISGGSIIEDALIGVEEWGAFPKATVTITGSTLNDNYINCQIDPSSIQPLLSITSSTVTCQSDGSYSPGVLKSPYSGRPVSYIGVNINNQAFSYIEQVGIAGATNTNTFSEMNYGVYAINASVGVYNNNFMDMSGSIPCSNCSGPYGIAVYAQGIGSGSTPFPGKVIVGSGEGTTPPTHYEYNTITNCAEGVYSQNILTTDVYNNIMSLGVVGVNMLDEGLSPRIQVDSNTIEDYSTGISLVGTYPGAMTPTIGMDQNYIYYTRSSGQMDYGIYVATLFTGGRSNINPFSFDIIQNGVFNGQFGIYVDNDQNFKTNVISNDIQIATPTLFSNSFIYQAGIYLVNSGGISCINNYVTCPGLTNTMLSASGPTYPTPSNADVSLVGIELYDIYGGYRYPNDIRPVACNMVGDVGQCIRFDADNSMISFYNNIMAPFALPGFVSYYAPPPMGAPTYTFSAAAPITKNSPSTCYDEFALENNAELFLPGQVIGNTFTWGLSTYLYAQTDVYNSNAGNFILNCTPYAPGHQNTDPVDNYQTSGTAYLNGVSLINPTSGPPSCPTEPARHSPIQQSPDSDGSIKQMQHEMDRIALDSVPYYVYIPEARYMGKQELYKDISADPRALTGDAILRHFYDSAQNTGIGSISMVGQLMAEGNNAAAQSLNNAFVPANLIEQNYKDVRNVYFQTLANGVHAATDEQLKTLWRIADQCSHSGGMAVEDARTLLDDFHHGPYLFIDSCNPGNAHGLSPTNIRVSPKKTINAMVYPNPANSLLNVEVSLQPGDVAVICLYNSLGQQVRCETLTSGLTTISAVDLPSGIYYYRISDTDGSLIKADKVMIMH